MTIVARIDTLIANLHELRQTASTEDNSEQFADALSSAVDEAAELGVDVDPIEEVAAQQPQMLAFRPTFAALTIAQPTNFEQFLTRDLLTTANESRSWRPNLLQFMEATGTNFSDASELIYGVIGSNLDLRNWRAIMASDNPVDATRAATRQLYNSDEEYELVQRPEYGTEDFAALLAEKSLSPSTTISQSDNFSVVGVASENDPTSFASSTIYATSSRGLLLRDAGQTKEQIERTAWVFGFDLQRIPSMSAQTRVWNSDLADVLDSIGRST